MSQNKDDDSTDLKRFTKLLVEWDDKLHSNPSFRAGSYKLTSWEPSASMIIEKFLNDSGLSEYDLKKQNLDELKESLIQIDEAINKLSTLNEKSAHSMSSIAIVVLPMLLEKKQLVLERKQEIIEEEQIKLVENKLAEGQKPDIRQEVEKILDVSKNLSIEINRATKERKEAEEKANKLTDDVNRRQQEREDRKEQWARWQSFLQRESVSTIVGAILLVIITGTFIIATFVKVTTPQILDNGFLVILGYFFGQTVAKVSSNQRSTGDSN